VADFSAGLITRNAAGRHEPAWRRSLALAYSPKLRRALVSDRRAQRGSRSVGSGADSAEEGGQHAHSAGRFRNAKAHRPAGGAEPRGRAADPIGGRGAASAEP
jgi:hypothetical protein